MTTKRVALVINTHSRKAESFFFRVLDELQKSGIEVTAHFPVRDPEKLEDAVKTAIADGNNLIIVGGGDGTISALVDYFVNKDVVLGILPLGTANSFIRSLGIPANPLEAVKVIAKGKVERIDVGKVNDTYYANVISFGYTTAIALDLSVRLKRVLGIFAYAYIGVRKTFSSRPFTMEVIHDGKTETFTTYQAIVANGSFYGPTSLDSHATVNSGKLVLLTMRNMSKFSLLRVWLGTLFGRSLTSYGVHHFSTSELTIVTKPQQAVSIDGEVVNYATLKLSLVPEGVQVMVPKSFQKRRSIRN